MAYPRSFLSLVMVVCAACSSGGGNLCQSGRSVGCVGPAANSSGIAKDCSDYFAGLEQAAEKSGTPAAKQAIDQAKAQYGEGTACWQSESARTACEQACSQGLVALKRSVTCTTTSVADAGPG